MKHNILMASIFKASIFKASTSAASTVFKRLLAGVAVSLSMLLISGMAWSENASTDKTLVTETLNIGGSVEHTLKLTVDDLRHFQGKTVGNVQLICQSGADKGKLSNIKGVLLRDLLDKAVIKVPDHNDPKKMVIVATASDGYKVVFSWSEIFNSPLGDSVIVYYEKSGMPLDTDEGRIAMVSTQDLRTGPRHVKWLQSIDVIKVTP